MSEAIIKRKTRLVTFAITTSASNSVSFRTDDMAGGVISVGTVSTHSSNLSAIVLCSESDSGEFRRLRDSAAEAADITILGNTNSGAAYSLPDAAFSVPFMKIVGGSTHLEGVPATVFLKS